MSKNSLIFDTQKEESQFRKIQFKGPDGKVFDLISMSHHLFSELDKGVQGAQKKKPDALIKMMVKICPGMTLEYAKQIDTRTIVAFNNFIIDNAMNPDKWITEEEEIEKKNSEEPVKS